MSGTTKFGTGSLNTSTGANNSAFGNYAAYHNGDASCNTAVGSNALSKKTPSLFLFFGIFLYQSGTNFFAGKSECSL